MPGDRSWVAFTLREEARWHDGRPVTVEDVVFSVELLKTKGHPFYRASYANVEKAVAAGERKGRFEFSQGDNRELPLIVGQMPILPKHYWEGRDFEKTTLDAPLGSGPYRIGQVLQGRSIVYERVEDYWGKDLPVNRGRHNFGRIRYDYYRDATIALEAFKAGEYDFREENVSKQWATGYDVANEMMWGAALRDVRGIPLVARDRSLHRPSAPSLLVRCARAAASGEIQQRRCASGCRSEVR